MIRLPNEIEIISIFQSILDFEKNQKKLPLSYMLNDDVSTISLRDVISMCGEKDRPNNIIISCDMAIESTDKPKKMTLKQFARKCVVASISDLNSKGIGPPYFSLVSLGISKNYSKKKIIELAKGFKQASKEFNIIFIGGDTNESKELIVDCTLMGFSKNNRLPYRSQAKEGDIIITSGKFGFSAAGLKMLLDKRINSNDGSFEKKILTSFLHPYPKIKFGTELGEFFSSSIDSSDGLVRSLYEIAKNSKVNILIDKIPKENRIIKFAEENNLNPYELIMFGGEEYEIIATIPKTKIMKCLEKARKMRLQVLVIGKVVKGEGKVYSKNIVNDKISKHIRKDATIRCDGTIYNLVLDKGYMHFVNQ